MRAPLVTCTSALPADCCRICTPSRLDQPVDLRLYPGGHSSPWRDRNAVNADAAKRSNRGHSSPWRDRNSRRPLRGRSRSRWPLITLEGSQRGGDTGSTFNLKATHHPGGIATTAGAGGPRWTSGHSSPWRDRNYDSSDTPRPRTKATHHPGGIATRPGPCATAKSREGHSSPWRDRNSTLPAKPYDFGRPLITLEGSQRGLLMLDPLRRLGPLITLEGSQHVYLDHGDRERVGPLITLEGSQRFVVRPRHGEAVGHSSPWRDRNMGSPPTSRFISEATHHPGGIATGGPGLHPEIQGLGGPLITLEGSQLPGFAEGGIIGWGALITLEGSQPGCRWPR